MSTTLPTDSNDRKNYALFSGCLRYFPAALAGVAKTSKLGNDKHNPGQEMHHARNKSQDHGDCIIRHLVDINDLLAAKERGEKVDDELILAEVGSMAWRALAFSQEIHEKLGAPLAPGAKVEKYEKKVAEPVGLYEQAEKAQQDISEMVKRNKAEIFNKVSGDEYKFLEKPKFKFSPFDVVKHINNDAVELTVQATYFDEKGNHILFVKDDDGKVFGVDPNFYKSIYKEKEQTNEGN